MRSNYNVNLFDLLMALSTAVDLVSPALSGHHKRVAHIAFGIGSELGWKPEALNDLVVAGALHDIGAFSLQQRTDTLQFDMEAPYRHAEAGYLFLRRFDLFSQTASVVRHHHARWDDGAGAVAFGEKVPEASHLLHLADRVDILIDRQRNVLGQAADITRRIEDNAGRMFLPPFVDAFGHLASREYFWLDAVSPHVDRILAKQVKLAAVELGMDEMENLAVLFSRIIDFKSSFTSTHTSGVAATAEALSGLAGFSQAERQQMRIAGYFHDLGKLAVPAEILEKPAKLTDQEFNVIRGHAFYTRRILEAISGLDVINEWASSHHERLDGDGYPFHDGDDELSLGARIVAVADVFTALAEDRPYRKAMTPDEILEILRQMTEDAKLDAKIVELLKGNFDEVNGVRMNAQLAAAKEYNEFVQALSVATG